MVRWLTVLGIMLVALNLLGGDTKLPWLPDIRPVCPPAIVVPQTRRTLRMLTNYKALRRGELVIADHALTTELLQKRVAVLVGC